MNTMATIESLSESVTAIGESIATTNGGLDVFYLLFAIYFYFLFLCPPFSSASKKTRRRGNTIYTYHRWCRST
jgi:hypothetical protein